MILHSVPLIGRELLRMGYPVIEPYDFYREIFGDGELDTYLDTSELAAISAGSAPRTGKYVGLLSYICKDEAGKRYTVRRSVLDDLDEIDAAWNKPHEDYQLAIMSPISYVGFSRKSSNARYLYALVVEIDDLIVKNGKHSGLKTLQKQWKNGFIPKPTYIVSSGSGIHLYYKFERPISLYENVVKSLSRYKKVLTKILWNQYITNSYQEEKIQYESIFQGFRVVGTKTKYGNGEVATAFEIGEPVSVEYMNGFIPEPEKECHIEAVYKSTLPLAEAKAKFPEWYEKRVVKQLPKGHWICNRAVYDWWLRKITFGAAIGHRYYCLMCLAIYAVKCEISFEELEKDCFSLMEQYDSISPDDNPFTEEDVVAALQIYDDREVFTYPINSIENRSGIHIEKNKRNGNTQKQHLELARSRKKKMKELGIAMNSPDGRPKMKEIVKRWKKENPNGKKADCIRDTGLTKPTVYKWWDA